MATAQELEKDLKNLVKKGLLGHAYVFHGQDAGGQLELAQQLANFLETGKWASPETTLLEVKVVDGAMQNLGVDVAREFSEFLYRQPVASPRRTLIIASAAEFTDQAQNAILKLVEEPPSHALILMTVRDVGSLLPPLRSRVQPLFLSGRSSAKKSAREEKAAELVEQFLMSAPAARAALIKEIVAADKEDDVEKSEKIVDTFVSRLIEELAKKPQQNARVLKEALKRQTAMADHSTNKKLQLEALAQYFN